MKKSNQRGLFCGRGLVLSLAVTLLASLLAPQRATAANCPGVFGDFVWHDLDEDGIQDPGEPGIEGVTVSLYDYPYDPSTNPTPVSTDVTDLDGYYSLGPVQCRTTYVIVLDDSTVPFNFVPTTTEAGGDTEADSNPNPTVAQLLEYYPPMDYPYAENLTIDFGFVEVTKPCLGDIGNFVWDDLDQDGIQDAGEPGIEGVSLSLFEAPYDPSTSPTPLDTQVTDANGFYAFEDVDCFTTYVVVVDESTLPFGYVASPTEQGGDDAFDSNPNPATVNLNIIYPPNDYPYAENPTIDFGYFYQEVDCLGQIGDLVWYDLNENGIQDEGEPGIEGVYLDLFEAPYDPGTNPVPLATAITDPNGNYLFDGVDCDTTYVVVLDLNTVPTGYVPTTTQVGTDETVDSNPNPATVVLTVVTPPNAYPYGENLDIDFGFIEEKVDCAPCDGKVTELSLVYTGDIAGAHIVVETKKTGVVFDGTVEPGEEFTFYGNDDKGTLGTEISVFVNNGLNTKIHTSCSKPIGPGLSFGDFDVTEAYSRNGGLICDFDSNNCQPCDGKVTQLLLQYNGVVVDAEIEVATKSDGVAFFGIVQPGDSFLVYGIDDKGTLGTEITISVNGVENAKMHTSCSQPIGPGLVRGDFLVRDGKSQNGGLLCEVDEEPPTSGDCEPCDGKVTELSMQYNGDIVDAEIVVHTKKDGVAFTGVLQPGDTFFFQGTDDKGTLGTEITISVNGVTNAAIHTSCSQPIGPGLIAGDFLVLDGRSRNGGLLCEVDVVPPPPTGGDDCQPCEGKITELTMQYNGGTADATIVVNTKSDGVAYVGVIQPGESFTFNGVDDKGTLGTEITISVNDSTNAVIHTSCSKPIGPGLIAGDFLVLAGRSREGGILCEITEQPDDGGKDDDDDKGICNNGKLKKLTLLYVAADCSASNNSQPDDKATCEDFGALGSAYIVVSDKRDLNDDKANILFEGAVLPGDSFMVVAPLEADGKSGKHHGKRNGKHVGKHKKAGKESNKTPRQRLKSNTYVHILNESGTAVLQEVVFHTSCSVPLFVGDQFGSIVIEDFELE